MLVKVSGPILNLMGTKPRYYGIYRRLRLVVKLITRCHHQLCARTATIVRLADSLIKMFSCNFSQLLRVVKWRMGSEMIHD